MKRRDFMKSAAVLPASVAIGGGTAAIGSKARAESATTGASGAGSAASAKSAGVGVPKWARDIRTTDMNGLGPDGAPTGVKATFTGSAGAESEVDNIKMELTEEEQAILDGKDGELKAKVLRMIVEHGEAFGATKLVDLDANPHSSLYFASNFMEPMISMFMECADGGMTAYAPYTVNPTPYDVYNVSTDSSDQEFIFHIYGLQRELNYIHAKFGAPDLNERTCACYTDEIGNAPAPGSNVAWAESSAVNYGNSVLGLKSNRNATGMELLCALVGKAPVFGLMTDEGRTSKWLIDVQTTRAPNWAALGTAVGRKVVEDNPYYVGLDKYFPRGLNNNNMHILKQMGSASASSGAVALYHVEGVTPEAIEKERDLLVEDYQTYVYDDAEQKKILETFQNLWEDKEGDPNAAFLGCPHLTYQELLSWGRRITAALDLRGQEMAAMPVYCFVARKVSGRLVEEEGELASRMKRAGIKVTNQCHVTYTSMKGFKQNVRGVTNSGKGRNYTPNRMFDEDVLTEIIVSGKIPA